MNDDELITALREQRGKVPMTTPVEQIISRGRSVRARRRVPQVAAALGATGAAAVAVGVAVPASYPAASHRASGPAVQLAAWTVARQADGTIRVTVREATDPAGLQRTLRADGVPVSVTFTGRRNPACHGSNGPLGNVAGYGPFGHLKNAYDHPQDAFRHPQDAFRHAQDAFDHTQDALVIHPSALPPGDGLQIWTSGAPGAADNFQLYVALVKTSPQCTGS